MGAFSTAGYANHGSVPVRIVVPDSFPTAHHSHQTPSLTHDNTASACAWGAPAHQADANTGRLEDPYPSNSAFTHAVFGGSTISSLDTHGHQQGFNSGFPAAQAVLNRNATGELSEEALALSRAASTQHQADSSATAANAVTAGQVSEAAETFPMWSDPAQITREVTTLLEQRRSAQQELLSSGHQQRLKEIDMAREKELAAQQQDKLEIQANMSHALGQLDALFVERNETQLQLQLSVEETERLRANLASIERRISRFPKEFGGGVEG